MVQRNLLRRARGRPPYPGIFTPAEQRVLQGLKRGHTYQQIADELGLSYDTVKYHVSNMLSKAQVERRDELVAFAGQPGLRWSALPTSLMWAGGAAAAAASVTFAVLVLVNRGGNDDPAAPDATQTAQASATPTIPASGVPIVDEFIKVALGGDLTKLEPLIDYQPVPCSSNQQGIGAPPPCPAGSADGTPVPAVFSSSCEGSYITESSMPGLLASWNLGFNGVFSASTIRPGSEESTDGPAAYSVVITFKQWADGSPVVEPRPGMNFLLSEKGVVGWESGCGGSARSLAARHPSYLIAPPLLSPVPADTPHVDVSAVDQVIDAIAVGDTATLAERTTTIEVGCGAERWLPRCPEGEPEGTLVPAVIRENCDERSWTAPFRLAEDFHTRLGANPTIFAIARGKGADGVEYWIVFDGLHPGVLGVTDEGQIAVINGGCGRQSATDLARRYNDFVLPPK